MVWRVILSELAESDLREVVAFLATRSQSAALRVGEEIIELIFSLHHLPKKGAQVRQRANVRKVCSGNFVIFCCLHETAQLVEIVRIWDGRRDPASFKISG